MNKLNTMLHYFELLILLEQVTPVYGERIEKIADKIELELEKEQKHITNIPDHWGFHPNT